MITIEERINPCKRLPVIACPRAPEYGDRVYATAPNSPPQAPLPTASAATARNTLTETSCTDSRDPSVSARDV